MSLLILVVDDEPEVECCFASTSGVTFVPGGPPWSLPNPVPPRFSELVKRLACHPCLLYQTSLKPRPDLVP